MKKNYIICVMGIFVVFSCKSSKNIEGKESQSSSSESVVNSYPKEIKDSTVTEKVTSVITEYLKVPLSSIAISKILLTQDGDYKWMFLNVRTGANYTASSNRDFENVKIIKKKKNRSELGNL